MCCVPEPCNDALKSSTASLHLQCQFRGTARTGRFSLKATPTGKSHRLVNHLHFVRGLLGPRTLRGGRAGLSRSYMRWVADRSFLVTFECEVFCYAVVKVPPPVGCVKYKAQHIVLPMQILLFLPSYKPINSKIPRNRCGILRIAAIIADSQRSARAPARPTSTIRCFPGPPGPSANPLRLLAALNETRPAQPPPQGAELVHPLCIPVGKWKTGSLLHRVVQLLRQQPALPVLHMRRQRDIRPGSCLFCTCTGSLSGFTS